MRQKTEYVSEKDESGKTHIRKVGLQFVQRDQVEFEFTLVGEIDIEHTMTISKTRVASVALNAKYDKPGATFARQLWDWLRTGSAPRRPQAATPAAVAPTSDLEVQLDERTAEFFQAMVATTTVPDLDAVVASPNKPPMGSAERAKANEIYKIHKAAILQRQAAS